MSRRRWFASLIGRSVLPIACSTKISNVRLSLVVTRIVAASSAIESSRVARTLSRRTMSSEYSSSPGAAEDHARRSRVIDAELAFETSSVPTFSRRNEVSR